jgi:hypothetical protein
MASRGCQNETRRRLVKRVETLDQKVGLDYSAHSEKTAVERITDTLWLLRILYYEGVSQSIVLSQR